MTIVAQLLLNRYNCIQNEHSILIKHDSGNESILKKCVLISIYC